MKLQRASCLTSVLPLEVSRLLDHLPLVCVDAYQHHPENSAALKPLGIFSILSSCSGILCFQFDYPSFGPWHHQWQWILPYSSSSAPVSHLFPVPHVLHCVHQKVLGGEYCCLCNQEGVSRGPPTFLLNMEPACPRFVGNTHVSGILSYARKPELTPHSAFSWVCYAQRRTEQLPPKMRWLV